MCYEVMSNVMGARTKICPFSCSHAICRSCDHKMTARNQNRCPTCRAPRRGMTAEQAAPPTDPPAVEFDAVLVEASNRFQGQISQRTRARGGSHRAPPTPVREMLHQILARLSQDVRSVRELQGVTITPVIPGSDMSQQIDEAVQSATTAMRAISEAAPQVAAAEQAITEEMARSDAPSTHAWSVMFVPMARRRLSARRAAQTE